MCGIAGFVSNRDRQPTDIRSMTDLMRHRGPDDEGFLLFRDPSSEPVVAGGSDTLEQSWVAPVPYAPRERIEQVNEMPIQIALGHRRLSIIDISPFAHQPMCYQNGRYWITYNGEIYNYYEIRSGLESRGYVFSSRSDTEVILAAYAQLGADCLNHFNGMWSFAIYDSQRKEIFLARDRFGVKPLYYWVAPDGTFCFASEIKAFSAFPGWAARVNPQRAYDFLIWGVTDHTDETLFADVYQIRPGHFLKLSIPDLTSHVDGHYPAKKWYDLRPAVFSGSFADAASEFRQRLRDSVRLRLRADVPVGSCLSGGLDSSAIVCLVNQLLGNRSAGLQKTFSACTDVKRFDERKWQEEVVRVTGADAHYVYPSLENLFNESSLITWHQDEPFASTSIYAQWNVFRLAAQNGVKVMLDGQGADELLAGYDGFFGSRFAALVRNGRFLRLWREVQAAKKLHAHSELRSLASTISMLLSPSLKNTLRKLFGKRHAAPSWLNLHALGAVAANPTEYLGFPTSSVQSLSYAQLTSIGIQALLHWEDRDSMAHSIEARVPFLDYRLVEFVLGLPDEHKLSDGITKRVFREGMIGVLPEAIRNRMDKLGFATPEEVWVKERTPSLFREKLQSAIDLSQGILLQKSMDTLDEMLIGRRPFSFLVWRMINFGQWMDAFSVTLNGH